MREACAKRHLFQCNVWPDDDHISLKQQLLLTSLYHKRQSVNPSAVYIPQSDHTVTHVHCMVSFSQTAGCKDKSLSIGLRSVLTCLDHPNKSMVTCLDHPNKSMVTNLDHQL